MEAMFYDLWESMREKDEDLANQVLEPTFIFMRAQTEKIRTEITEIGEYLQYREKDVGKAYVPASFPVCVVAQAFDGEWY